MKVIALSPIRWRGRLRLPGAALGLSPASVEAKLAKGSVRLPTEEELQTWPSELPDDEEVFEEETSESGESPEIPGEESATRAATPRAKASKKASKKKTSKR